MSVAFQAEGLQCDAGELRKQVVNLFSQQIWCWGQDVQRPAGNWLLELGFQRIEPPESRESCSSVYTLELPKGRRVTLRGFGVFYGDDALGGIFQPRFEYQPRYLKDATLECPPWSNEDLPKSNAPNNAQRDACTSLVLGLIDWIRSYEVAVAERLGIEYRESTLSAWNSGKRVVIPAEQMASAWRRLGVVLEGNFHMLLPLKKKQD